MKNGNIPPDGVELELQARTFHALPTPPTVDDIVDAVDRGLIQASGAVLKALNVLRRGSIEQFNFGPLKLDTIRAAQKDAIDFVTYGHFIMPFPVCLFRASIIYDNTTVGYTVLTVDGRDGVDDKFVYGVAGVGICHNAEGVMIAMNSINMMRTTPDKVSGEMAVELQVPSDEMQFWRKNLGAREGHTLDGTIGDQATEGSMLAMGLTMILNTKGVLKERREPPEKPNKVRQQRGRPPLPFVTRVYTDLYARATEAGEPGTHASPRPHIRRAHVRHYPQRGDREAYTLPIESMLVNWDGAPIAPRASYEVK